LNSLSEALPHEPCCPEPCCPSTSAVPYPAPPKCVHLTFVHTALLTSAHQQLFPANTAAPKPAKKPKAKASKASKATGKGAKASKASKPAKAKELTYTEKETQLTASLTSLYETTLVAVAVKQAAVKAITSKKGKNAAQVVIARTLKTVNDKAHAVEVSATVGTVWNNRFTAGRARMLAVAGDETLKAGEGFSNDDGPLGFVYGKVMSVEMEVEGKKKDGSGNGKVERIMVFFYGKWAEQMEVLLRKGDDLKMVFPSACIFKNSAAGKGEHPWCVCVGDTVTPDFSPNADGMDENVSPDAVKVSGPFGLDAQVKVVVISKPGQGAGVAAQIVEIGLTSENVGTVERQQPVFDPFLGGKRAGSLEIDGAPVKKQKKEDAVKYTKIKDLMAIAESKEAAGSKKVS